MSRCQTVTLFALVFACAGIACAQEEPAEDNGAEAKRPEPPEVVVPFYGNTVCPISSREVKRSASARAGSERIYVCCRKCKKKVAADPDAYVDQAYPRDEIKDLANKKCPISGRDTRDGVSLEWQGHRVLLCCDDCTSTFEAAPARTLTLMLNPDLKELGNRMCLVMDDEENDSEEFFVYGDLLIDSCCSDCPEEFAESPEKFLAAYRQANPAKGESADDPNEVQPEDGR